MSLKKAIIRSIVVIMIATASVAVGFLIEGILDKIDRRNHPQSYSQYISVYSEAYGVPEYIVYAVIKTESGFDSSAVSSDGAIGLMQIMPETFKWLTTLLGDSYETGMLYDPATNIKYGTYYLSYLYGVYARWPTVYAAYNAGPSAVDRWLEDKAYSDDGTNLEKIPYPETEAFVSRVERAAETYLRLYYKD
ncbi:MAG: lytic transglycosylase domain-containing protein [Eubacteriales bacterium]|jgi:soluble lytic murein transglycosylase|nr:lytic transglycosylase domain-containing protein [Clostridiales bacterium]